MKRRRIEEPENPFLQLDNGALFSVFKFLDAETLSACRFVCKQFNKVACTDLLWKEFAEKARYRLTRGMRKLPPRSSHMTAYNFYSFSRHGSKNYDANVAKFLLNPQNRYLIYSIVSRLCDDQYFLNHNVLMSTCIVRAPNNAKRYVVKTAELTRFSKSPALAAYATPHAETNSKIVNCFLIITRDHKIWCTDDSLDIALVIQGAL